MFYIFDHYLAGLIEGDGSIIVPKHERSSKGKLYYASIQIVFSQDNFPLCQAVQEIIGHGSIQKVKKKNAYVLCINNYEGLVTVVNMINGKMRGPKYNQLIKLISYLNNKSSNCKIEPKGYDTSYIGSNSWFTGFIEADGSFQVRTTFSPKYNRVSVSFEISQSSINHYEYSMYDVMKSIADFFETDVKEIIHKSPTYRVRTTSMKTNKNIINYINKYPLKGTKYIDFLDWYKVFKYIEEKSHMKNIEVIIKIKSQMNSRRTTYN